jgi:hypothetical protein
MGDVRLEQQIEKQFATDCLGKSVCSMFLNFTAIFDDQCQKELKDRLTGNTFYGPPKVLALTQCVQEDFKVGKSGVLSKDAASRVVVWIDVSIVLIFVLAIFRLKFYEELSLADLRHGQMRIEDFSLLIQDIPIDEKDYQNNPDLLAAMMVGHIEDICAGEAQALEEMEDDEMFNQETSH